MNTQSSYAMDVGDPRRALVGRAAFGTLLAAGVFFVFTMTKQIRPVYLHAPWYNDPYDTVFSFTMFFVPLVAVAFLMQVSLCHKTEALPIGRVVTILRGCRIAVGAIFVELLSAWISVALVANRSQWAGGVTTALITLLFLSTMVTARALVVVVRAPRLQRPPRTEEFEGSDWLADVLAVAERESHWLGPLRGRGLSTVDRVDRGVVRRVRRRPVGSAAVASVSFAVVVFGWQAIREGYIPSVTLLEIGLGFCGMFAFLVIAGSYWGIVRSATPLHGARRRALDAGVGACVAAIAVLAFRDSLWWMVGSDASAAGSTQFAALLGCVAIPTFALILVAETLLHRHSNNGS